LQGEATHNIDTWSLGWLLWEMACDETPFLGLKDRKSSDPDAETDQVRDKKIADFFLGELQPMCDGLPDKLQKFMKAALQVDVKAREAAFPNGLIGHDWHQWCKELNYTEHPTFMPVLNKKVHAHGIVEYVRNAESGGQ
jgi:hypothetical protein